MERAKIFNNKTNLKETSRKFQPFCRLILAKSTALMNTTDVSSSSVSSFRNLMILILLYNGIFSPRGRKRSQQLKQSTNYITSFCGRSTTPKRATLTIQKEKKEGQKMCPTKQRNSGSFDL
jgi:hypothetical protein